MRRLDIYTYINTDLGNQLLKLRGLKNTILHILKKEKEKKTN